MSCTPPIQVLSFRSPGQVAAAVKRYSPPMTCRGTTSSSWRTERQMLGVALDRLPTAPHTAPTLCSVLPGPVAGSVLAVRMAGRDARPWN
jgi:hypothetical protein